MPFLRILHAICFLVPFIATAQLAGTYTVPVSFTSVASAVNSLNTVGVSGPVTINIAAGYTETVPFGGLILNTIAGSSSLSPVTFQKFGSGASPVLYAYTGGTATAASARQDGIWSFTGTDYVTVDGITLQDQNNTAGATMEYGFGFFKNNAADGCQFNTIRNCTVSLNRSFAVGAPLPFQSGARGINLVNAHLNAQTTTISVLAVSGTHSENKFYGNLIQNTNVGITLVGYSDVPPFTYADRNNQVGGSLSGTGNTIQNYGLNTSTVTAAGVVAASQYSFTVKNNNIDNHVSGSASTYHSANLRGIMVFNAGGSDLAITGNSVQLNSNAYSGTLALIENASASVTAVSNTIDISNNYFNGTILSANSTAHLYGIRNLAGAESLNISGNTFTNSALGNISGQLAMISNRGMVTGSLAINSNTITASISSFPGFQGTFRGINNTVGLPTTSVQVSNNFFEKLTCNTGTTNSFYLIDNDAAKQSSLLISNNIFNSLVMSNSQIYFIRSAGEVQNALAITGNSIQGTFTRTLVASGTVNFISSGGSGDATHLISNNNFSNVLIVGNGTFNGITCSAGQNPPYGRVQVYNNVVSNVNFQFSSQESFIINCIGIGDGNGTGSSSIYSNTVSNISMGSAVSAIKLGASYYSPGPVQVYSNNVYSITSSGTSSVTGIQADNLVENCSFYKNKIAQVSSSSSGGIVAGARFVNCDAVSFYNNLVGHISASVSTHSMAVNGIHLASGRTYSVYNNSVYLTGNSSASNYQSNAIYVSATPTVELINNIFANLMTGGGGQISAMRRSANSYSTYSNNSDNNLFYCGTAGSNKFIHHNGVTSYSTLALYKAILPGLEPHSVTENPPFASSTPSTSNYLSIFPSFTTQIESGGQYLQLVTDDYAGTVRTYSTTDIGAWEGNYTGAPSDLFPPVLSASGYSSGSCNLSQRVVTVQVSDVSSVASGSLVPRIYYKLNTGSYTNTAGSLLSGNMLSGVWSFSMNYSASVGDVVSYFVVAQDVPGNVIMNPVAGGSVVGVNSVVTTPTNPVTFTVGMVLNGGYSVGSGGTFTSLGAAANAYNLGCLTGPVTFSLISNSYSSSESFPVVFQKNPTAGPTNSLLIRPAAATAVTIQPASAGPGVLKFLLSSYITVDGINSGGSSLLVSAVTSTQLTGAIWLASNNDVLGGNDHFTIRNTVIKGGDQLYGYGVVACNNATAPSVYNTGGAANSFVSVTNNTITNCRTGVGTAGQFGGTMAFNSNWTITGNVIGPPSAGGGEIGGRGIYGRCIYSLTVSGNTVQNVSTSEYEGAGIFLESYVDGFDISNNVFSAITSSNNQVSVIKTYDKVVNGKIDGNVIDNVLCNYYSYGSSKGIAVEPYRSRANIRITNNFISNLKGSSGGIGDNSMTGILVRYYDQDVNIDIDNNTVVLSGFLPGYNGATGSSPFILAYYSLYDWDYPGTINLRNNIFVNTFDNFFSTTDVNFCVYSEMPLSAFNSIENNCYYTGGSGLNTVYAHFDGTDYATYPQMLTYFGSSLNSQNVLPVFQSSTNLHIVPTSTANVAISNSALSLSTVPTDIDATTRGSSPDIGADEFVSTAVCSGASGGTLSATALTVCSSQSIALSSTGVNVGQGSAYQWKYSLTSGGTYSNLVTGSGLSTPNVSATIGNAGTYYIVMQAACYGTATAISNEATVTVLASPAPTVAANSTLACAALGSTLTAGGASSYTWNNGSTGSVLIVPSNSQGNYFVLASTPGCETRISNIETVVYGPVINVSVSASPVIICPGETLTLSASGAATYTWTGFSPAQTVTLAPAVSAVYTLNATDVQGCLGTGTVAATILPSPTLAVSGPPLICAGVTTVLTASGASTYTWLNTALSGSASSVTQSVGTTYTVQGTSVNGCTAEATYFMGITTTLNLSVSGTNTLCPGGTVSHSASGAANYLWTTPQGTFNTQTVSTSPAASAVYTVSGTTNSCVGTGTFNVTVFVPSITVTGNTITCSGTSVALTASGAGNYSWQPIASTGSQVNVAPLSDQVYTVQGIDGHGCAASQTYAVFTNSLPVVVISPSSATTCAQTPVVFTVTTPGTYTWSNGGGNNAVASFTPLSSQVFSVGVVDAANGCFNSGQVGVTVNTLPVVSVTGNSVICNGQTAILTASGASTYSWNTGTLANTVAVSPSANASYTVIGTNASGCSSGATFAVVSNSLPVLTITSQTSTVCALTPASFTASGASTYTWSVGGNSPVLTTTPATSTVYSVSGTNVAGCVSTQTVAITTNSLPVVSVSPSSATVCALSVASFTASGGASYVWSNSGGNNATANFSPVSSTSYSVIAFAPNGCSATAVAAVTTKSLPIISVTGTNAVCAGIGATLSAQGASSYSWSTGALSNTAAVLPSVTGTYIVTGTNALGCSSVSAFVLTVYTLPTINIVSSAGTVCVNSPVTFTANGANTYTWSNNTMGATTSATPTAFSTYTVTGTDLSGCVNTRTVAVSVNSLPSVSVSPSTATVCEQSPVSFTATGATTFSWSNGGGTNASATYTPSSPSSYTVTGTNAVTGCSGQQTVSVSTYVLPVVSVVGPTAVCAGQSATLTGSGAVTYTWVTGSASVGIIVAPSANTVVSVAGTDSNGCEGSGSLSLSVLPLPDISVSGSSVICPGTSGTLTASGASNYTWSNGATTGVIVVNPSVTSVYTNTGTGSNGCIASAVFTVNVDNNPVVTISGSSVVCAGKSATLTASGAGTYSWSNAANTNVIVVSPSVTTVYQVTGFAGAAACQGTAQAQVNVNPLPVVGASADKTVTCLGGLVTLSGSGALSYSWTGGALNGIAFSPAASGVFSVTGTDANNCENSAGIFILVHSLPPVNVHSDRDTICEGSSVVITATGALTFTWSSGEQTDTLTVYPLTGANSYTVSGTDLNGCEATYVHVANVFDCTAILNHEAGAFSCEIYPNPNVGEFTIAVSERIRNASFEVFNTVGQLVCSGLIHEMSRRVDLGEAAKGLYLVRVLKGKNEIARARLIKQ